MKRLSSFVLLFALLQLSLLLAAIPQQVNYQGFLSDSSGNPLNQTVALTATIYSDSLGVTSLWSEVHPAIVVTNGKFAVVLGSVTTIPATVFSGVVRWLGIRVNADPELRPLRPLLSTPSSFRSLVADTSGFAKSVADNSVTSAKIANGTIQLGDLGQNSATAGEVIKWNGTAWEASPETESSGGWTDMGAYMRLATETDSVAIGVAVPTAKLHVEGNLRLRQGGDILFGATNCKINSGTEDLLISSSDDLYLEPEGVIRIRDFGAADWMWIDPALKEIGVGTLAPEDMLHIENNAVSGAAFLRVESSNASSHGETGIRFETPQNRWHLRMDDYTNNNIPAGSLSLRSQDGATEALTVLEDGKVGIGTTAPTRKLHVNGSVQVKDTLYAGAVNPSLIAASRQPNEPGLAMNILLNEVYLDYTSPVIVSETITVPDSGYVLAFATATGSMDHTWGDNDDMEVTISEWSTYLSPFNRAGVRLPMNAGSGTYVFTLSPIAAFYVDSAGAYTYRLYGHKNGAAETKVDHARLTLLYVPTFYGTIFWEASNSDVDVPSAVQQSGRPQDSAIATKSEQLPAEMKPILKELVAEEVAKLRKEFEDRINAIEESARR